MCVCVLLEFLPLLTTRQFVYVLRLLSTHCYECLWARGLSGVEYHVIKYNVRSKKENGSQVLLAA